MARRRRFGWYSVSVETLRGFGILLSVAALVALGFFGYRHWEAYAVERQASQVITETRELVQQLESHGDLRHFYEEFEAGRNLFTEAVSLYDAGDLRGAVEQGKRSRNVLAAILSDLGRGGEEGEARFLSVSGNVEFRRGDSGDWKPVRPRVVLQSDDHVRTSSNGSAEVMFADGTLYTVSPNTAFVVTGRDADDEQRVTMEHGWLDLETGERPTRVDTPGAQARVDRDTEAFVAYESESRSGRIGALRGGVEVVNDAGQQRRLGELEQVTERNGRLSETSALPPPPQLLSPRNNRDIDAARVDELTLEWATVPRAAGYSLQVSRNKLFVDNLIEDTARRKTSARLGIQGEGTFYWRVASEAEARGRGPWSPLRKFRVAAVGGEGDTEPPELEIRSAVGYGSIFIVEGRTEPGASVVINDEPVQVNADGDFTKTIQLAGDGFEFITVQARDAWGNVTDRRRRVYIESP